MAGDKRVDYELAAQDKTGQAFDSLKARLRDTERGFDSMKGVVASLAAVGGAALVSFFGAASKAAEEARQATLRLEAVLRATGNVSGYTASQLEELADHMADLTQFDDEGFRTATATILRFGDVSGKQLERLLKLSADYAAFTNGDLVSSAETLGRAVASPAQGIEKLQRSVGYLTESQKEAVKALEETGDRIGAQGRLLDILEGKIGGTAEALNSGLTKSVRDLNKAFNELMESFGRIANNAAVTGVIDGVTSSFRAMKAVLEGDWSVRAIALMNALTGGLASKIGFVPDLGKPGSSAPTPSGAGDAAVQERAQQERERAAMKKLEEELLKHNKWMGEQDKKYFEEKERLRKEDDAGWVRYAQSVFDTAEENDLAMAKIHGEFWENEARLRKLDEAGWIAYIEARQAEDEALLIAEGNRHKSAMELRDEALKREQRMWDQAGDFAGAFFSDLVMNGRKAFDNLRDSLKQLLADMIALFAKRWILNLAAGGGLLGSAGAALAGGVGGDSLAGGGLSLLSNGSSALGAGSWFAGTGFGEGLSMGFQSGVAGPGAGMGETFGAAIKAASGALMIFAAVIGGVMVSMGLYDRGWGVDGETNIGDSAGRFSPEAHISGAAFKIGQAFGLSDKWASILSGQTLVARTFGHSATNADAFGIRGSVGDSGITGENWQDYSQRGGWFRSDRRWTENSAFSSEQTAFFADLFKNVSDTTSRLGDLLGVDSSQALAGYSRDFNLNFDENGKDPEEVAKLIQQRLSELLAGVLQDQVATVLQAGGKTGLSKFISDLTGASDEVIATIDALVNALGILGETISVEDIVAQASKTSTELFRDQGAALMTLASNTALSTDSLNALSSATLEYKSSAAQLILGLESAKRQIDAMFGDTARNIKLAGMDEQGQYNFYQNESERLLDLALKSNDAGEIQRLSGLINQDINAAFALLSPEQQVSMQQEWLTRIEQANADIQARLSEVQQEAQAEVNANLQKIQDLLEKNATDQQAAANVQLEASQNQLAASRTPTRVTVDVSDSGASSLVNEGG